ncbi:aromatic ring-hydroxylating dioxygenase subunit alpha [Paenibacillus sonchi]|uniref:Aromatic ring-hydroxylating dioxygenase subunit alpha n=1 Tax=Paenibacillus sonchi TaxID=373687 RepID=A0A974P9P1_9BACL|nr:aromatic ring-hydroxylating dioxygenase subunit alpha [Paenibacillus sonchi]MCE3200401.1 aromatic ring-hydroxylating dioxygenase subunit alpha [Paenibacillus sonchi]QQZ59363.1 aromatic ring-hydroxylating dioxygenase subunit alpha [Paenibacillus sonchi]
MIEEKKKPVQEIELPRDCTFSPEDWRVLAEYWYPVAIADEVQDKPLAVKLLDMKLVCYRSEGKVVIARDLCFHRGAPLSKGWMENGEIVCPYHGFRYNCEGKCTAVPAHPSSKISPKLKLIVYPAVERYGLIWTCLGSAAEQIPDFPGWEDPDYINILPPGFDIAGSSGRQMEGFLDVSHFAYVHTATFGDRNNTEVPQYKVRREGNELVAEYWSTVSNYGKGQENPAPEGFMWLREFRVFPPFAASLTVYFPDEGRLNILNCASPVSARYTRLFCPISRNFDKSAPVEDTIKFNLQVFAEDAEMVEAQTPEDLPLDLQAEAHIPADRTSIAYRQLLTELGLGRSYTS